MAAHSTTRALLAAYNGPLYQVKRTSDGAATNISTLSAGGYANAAAQDSFCSGTYSNFHLFLEPNDGSALFAQDATFCPRAGNSGSNFSFMSLTRPA